MVGGGDLAAAAAATVVGGRRKYIESNLQPSRKKQSAERMMTKPRGNGRIYM